MNRRSPNYLLYRRELLAPNITRRKDRLLRISANKRKRELGLTSKHLADPMKNRGRLADDQFIGRDGWPISLRAYIRHMEDVSYQCLASDWYRGVRVSTVWMGKHWPHGFGDSYYLFETMTFWKDKDAGITQRYSTEADALKGHAEVLEQVKAQWGGDPSSFINDDGDRITLCTPDDTDVLNNYLEAR